MAKRVEYTSKDGVVKNLETPLATRLQNRKLGKITKVLAANKNAKYVSKLENEIFEKDIEISELKAKMKKIAPVKNRETKPKEEAVKRETK